MLASIIIFHERLEEVSGQVDLRVFSVLRTSLLISFPSPDFSSLAQYMAFGLSGSESFTFMEGADVTVAWVDNDRGAMAQDYHLRAGERTQVRVRDQ